MWKSSVHVIGILFLILLSALFLFASTYIQSFVDSFKGQMDIVKKEFKAAQTLSSEGPKDVIKIDLITTLTDYCNNVKIPVKNCNVTTSKAIQRKDFTSKKYKVRIDNVLMDKAVAYYQKLEALPEKVRVVSSRLKKVQPRSIRGGKTAPYLELDMEMNVIDFKGNK